jgi:hypothetical protein
MNMPKVDATEVKAMRWITHLVRERKWHAAYGVADELKFLRARKLDAVAPYVHTPATVTNIREYMP